MTHTFRIASYSALIIEWQADLPGARWCFYKICDSPNDAKRSLAAIRGEKDKTQEDEQQALFDLA